LVEIDAIILRMTDMALQFAVGTVVERRGRKMQPRGIMKAV
jgi:hypothetical protein